jgi:hypothetical protein
MQNRNINKKIGCGYYDEISKKKKSMNQNEFTMQNDSYMGFFGFMSSIILHLSDCRVNVLFHNAHGYYKLLTFRLIISMKSLDSNTIIKILQLSVKSGEHGTTSTLSLVQNRVKCTTFLCQTEFDPVFPFPWEVPGLLYRFSLLLHVQLL